MAYNQKFNNNNGSRNQRRNDEPKKDPFQGVEKITEPLSVYYANRAEVYLPEQMIYKTAQSISKLSNSQIRKVLDLTKEALTIVMHSESDFEKARTRLFTLLPMTAYNTGRASKNDQKYYECLLQFIYKNVNPESIQSGSDIAVFDQLITSLVAYHKYLGEKK